MKRRCKYGRRKDGKCRKTPKAGAGGRRRKKKCKYGVNKNTGGCLKGKRKRR